jgi:hypothetical protein
MERTDWFVDQPVIGKMPPEQAIVKLREVGEEDVADMLEITQEARTKAFGGSGLRSWLHVQDRPWEHTAHTFGYLTPASPGDASLPLQSIGTVATDTSLKHARIKITFSRLAEGSYLAVQFPENQQARWDWHEWIYHPGIDQVVQRTNPLQMINYNYLVFGIGCYEGK